MALLDQRLQHGLVSLFGRESPGVDLFAQRGIEILRGQAVLLFGVLRHGAMHGQPLVAGQPQPAGVAHQRPEGLETRTGAGGVGEQEITLPEAFAGYGVVRLSIDGEQQTRPGAALW